MQYLRPEDLTYRPQDPVLSQLDFRKEQLLMRAAEVKATLEVVRRLNTGEGGELAKENRRAPAGAGGDAGLPLWKGRLSADATMAGHSFGGATTVSTATCWAHESSCSRLYNLEDSSPASWQGVPLHSRRRSRPVGGRHPSGPVDARREAFRGRLGQRGRN